MAYVVHPADPQSSCRSRADTEPEGYRLVGDLTTGLAATCSEGHHSARGLHQGHLEFLCSPRPPPGQAYLMPQPFFFTPWSPAGVQIFDTFYPGANWTSIFFSIATIAQRPRSETRTGYGHERCVKEVEGVGANTPFRSSRPPSYSLLPDMQSIKISRINQESS